MDIPPDALARVRLCLRQACGPWELSSALANSCVWLGVVGWALLLAQDDGSHLFPCGIGALPAMWQPPLRPLERSGPWPVCRAALGQSWTGQGMERPYPLPAATSPAASAALPLRKTEGALVALRPGQAPFTDEEQAFLASVADEVSDALLGLPLPHRADALPRLRQVERGAFVLDLGGQSISCDRVFAEQHRLAGPGRHPLSRVLAALPVADLPRAGTILGQLAAEPDAYEVIYRVLGGAGVRTLQARCSPRTDADDHVVLAGHVTDITYETDHAAWLEQRMHQQVRRAEQIGVLASACASARTTGELATAAHEVLAVFGADAVVLAEAVDGRLRLMTHHGQHGHHLEALRDVALCAATPLTDALREHRPVFISSHDDLVQVYPHYANTAPRLDRHAWAALPVPVSAPGARPTACLLSFSRPHAFTAEDHALLIAAAGLLGRALERCHAWETEHTRALELQRGLLPARLTAPPGTELAASYLPAAAGAHAGGDWYDALTLADGRLLLAVGDVEGHDTQAASLMGRVRTAIRAYAALIDDPALLLHHTNRLLTEDNDADPARSRTATCCLLVLDPATGRLDHASAGHAPPLAYVPPGADDPGTDGPGADHGRRRFEAEPGLPLGIFADSAYTTTSHQLPEGAQLLLYTDGLTDRSGVDPERARELLYGAFQEAASLPVTHALGHVTDRCLSRSRPDDDCALLLVRCVRHVTR
ncbi:PP2C family protein-serine/threonine phosphatase [Streptomyces sp. NPDC001941]|uniref:PP2C family protein-serine/threonine phosphatase n=1 Tax=Streptomyces sp. NPDC001941 TaxID=3154659 RepID=UPI003329A7DC